MCESVPGKRGMEGERRGRGRGGQGLEYEGREWLRGEGERW